MKKTLELVCQAELKAWDLLDFAGSAVVFEKEKTYSGLIVDDITVIAVGEDGVPYTVTQGIVPTDLQKYLDMGRPYWQNPLLLEKNKYCRFKMSDPPITCIETDVHEPVPDKPGYVRWARQRKAKDVYAETVTFLKERGLFERMEYFYLSEPFRSEPDADFPKWRSMMCYATPGGSEGYMVHVDCATEDGTKSLFRGKFLTGFDNAFEAAQQLTKVFYERM